jgi:hypothetical protein
VRFGSYLPGFFLASGEREDHGTGSSRLYRLCGQAGTLAEVQCLLERSGCVEVRSSIPQDQREPI